SPSPARRAPWSQLRRLLTICLNLPRAHASLAHSNTKDQTMKHLLMDPAFPDLVGQLATEQIDDSARVWTVTRGADGRLEERLDPTFLQSTEPQTVDDIVEALVFAAAQQDVAETRIW